MANDLAGAKLQQALTKIAKNLAPAGGKPQVKVGFLSGATYPDGTSVAMVAAVNAFGAPSRGQPPRPFFQNMIAQHGKQWPDQVAKLLKAHDYDARIVLGLMGELIVGQLKQSINDLVEPPLAPSTIAAKGFDKPLIETSHMINSADYEVVDGSDGS